MRSDIKELIGKTLVSCEQSGDSVLFETTEGQKYSLHHEQDCCENVTLEDVEGNLPDLVGSPLIVAEEVGEPAGFVDPHKDGEYERESFTWTFYRFATQKGWVVLRWYGESNGYYSESVDFYQVKP